MIDNEAIARFKNALREAKKEGGRIIFGGEILSGESYSSGNYVSPHLLRLRIISVLFRKKLLLLFCT